jgi:hypothetical protein
MTTCWECNAECNTEGNLTEGERNHMYCDDCWKERYDYCYVCEVLVDIGQETPPYGFDEKDVIRCICDKCMPSWEEYVNAYKVQQQKQEQEDELYNNIKYETSQN